MRVACFGWVTQKILRTHSGPSGRQQGFRLTLILTFTPVGLSVSNKVATMPKAVSPANPPLPDVTAAASPWKLNSTAPKQSRDGYWVPLPGLASVHLMDLRVSTCRWPVDDPRHSGQVRFCGAACGTEASYCAAHKKIGTTPSRGSTSRPAFFRVPTVSKVA